MPFSMVLVGISACRMPSSPNNSYQASLKKSPFEALYGRKCRTPLYWDQIVEKQLFGPDIIEDAEQMVQAVPYLRIDPFVLFPSILSSLSGPKHQNTRERKGSGGASKRPKPTPGKVGLAGLP